VRFLTTVVLGGKTATGLRVPPEVLETLGSGKKPAVTVTLNGYTYRSTVGSMGGEFMIPLSAQHRQAAGVAAGDELDVQVELDTAPRILEVPADLAAALDAEPAAKAAFEALSYSNKRRFTMPIDEAKTAETRQRRIDKTISTLLDG
jgi:hypothetical protein